MSGISTHVLDTTRGLPAAGIPVILEHEAVANRWRVIINTKTDEDGRITSLLPAGTKLATGSYRLRFETGAYFKHHKLDHFHPRVEVAFTITDIKRKYPIPLLVSPFGYTTYRGS